MVGVSIRSAPHRRHNLPNTGQEMWCMPAIMCEPCIITGTVIAGSSVISLKEDRPLRIGDQNAISADLDQLAGFIVHLIGFIGDRAQVNRHFAGHFPGLLQCFSITYFTRSVNFEL